MPDHLPRERHHDDLHQRPSLPPAIPRSAHACSCVKSSPEKMASFDDTHSRPQGIQMKVNAVVLTCSIRRPLSLRINTHPCSMGQDATRSRRRSNASWKRHRHQLRHRLSLQPANHLTCVSVQWCKKITSGINGFGGRRFVRPRHIGESQCDDAHALLL
jgi:hypothetical protein